MKGAYINLGCASGALWVQWVEWQTYVAISLILAAICYVWVAGREEEAA